MPTSAITTAFCKSPPPLQAGQRKVRYTDPSITGFTAEVWPSGSIIFWLRYTDPRGRSREEKLGRFGDVTVDQARRRAKELRAQVSLGGDPAAERDKLRGIPTFASFVTDKYLPYVKERLRSYRDHESFCRLRLLPRWGTRRLDEIPPSDIVALQTDLRAQGLSNATANRYTVLVRRIFNLAIQWEVITIRNPAKNAELLREQGRERFLTVEQTRRLFRALDDEPSKTAAACLGLLALTGARKSEALKMRWDDVDIARRSWRVSLSKSGRARHIPLSDAALRILQLQSKVAGCAWVFPNRDADGPLENVRKCWERVRQRAGLDPDLHIHDLRHAFASRLVNEGRPIYEVAQILGHAQLQTTQRYAHFANERLVDAANVVGRVALAASTPSEPT